MVTRLCRLVCLLLAVSVLAPAAPTVGAQDASPIASPLAGSAPLDVAAMALTPDDLADRGFASFLIADGRTQTVTRWR